MTLIRRTPERDNGLAPMKPQKLDPVQTYEKAIGAKALSEKKLEALAAKMKKNSKKLRMSFTQGAMWIPLKITKDYQVRHSDWALMDLAEEANLGLFAAVDHLPERKSSQSIVKFITGWVETSLDEAIRQIAEQTNQNKPTSAVPKAMKLFQTLEGEPCALKYRGVRTTRSPSGEEKIHLTAVPFGKDGALAKLASAAQTAGEPLLAFVVQGDPDEDLEALLDNYKRKIGKWNR